MELKETLKENHTGHLILGTVFAQFSPIHSLIQG